MKETVFRIMGNVHTWPVLIVFAVGMILVLYSGLKSMVGQSAEMKAEIAKLPPGRPRWAAYATSALTTVVTGLLICASLIYSLSIVFAGGCAVFLIVVLCVILTGVRPGWRKWVSSAAVILAMVGAAGFWGCVFSSEGLLNWLPESFEWPVGYASGVVSTDSGLIIVPHEPSGRVQIYDADLRFVRGWQIGSGAGRPFRLKVSDDDLIEVIITSPDWHRKFDLEGRLLSQEMYVDSDSEPRFYDTYPDPGVSGFVRTPFWLMPFASPGIGSMVCVGGMVLAFCVAATGAKRKPREEAPCDGGPDDPSPDL